ncbi:tRNA (adenosine(37)-N6)-dimethylallyltransferase MiaA [Gaoshiqia sediminis]|uniref:tRNA dimethylallyltransferase n=1 Tax=Gaoshiqia sediminis TaxID=2986998 RepID=A0AA41YAV9_9BACT|nr:tRNA (adenosine(37)-N6)-dimethylallyltransferase MiaA [Gaoshiqia sediminis]MCW0484627.1 tRNA (adenosine(37)-N6)-dimethylallyltransferase MiaA [Gaoshiqia sediminis]
MHKTLLVLLGPTGIGKSDLGIRLAQHFHTEIISSDSRQIYRELSIGTAVPPPDDLKKVKHHLIHSHSINDYYSASRFEQETLQILDKLFARHDQVIMTGGSMLYIDAVCKGIDDIPDADPKLRAELNAEYEDKGIEHLRLQLKKLDPEYYAVVDLKNAKRLLHALEICLTTGKTYTSLRTNQGKERPFNILKIGLNRDRAELYDRINQRVDLMMRMGLEEEARSVYHLRNLNALNTVGYKELFAWFDGETDRETAIELIKRNSRHYARKQLTWFRKDPSIHWFAPKQEQEIIQFIHEKINQQA